MAKDEQLDRVCEQVAAFGAAQRRRGEMDARNKLEASPNYGFAQLAAHVLDLITAASLPCHECMGGPGGHDRCGWAMRILEKIAPDQHARYRDHYERDRAFRAATKSAPAIK